MAGKALTGRQLLLLSAAGLLLSITVHLAAVLHLYFVPNSVIILFSLGMLFVWLQAGTQIKIFREEDERINPWRAAWSFCSPWLKYLFYFSAVYALVNFAAALEPAQQAGYIDLNVSQAKLRGISGFWPVFYLFGVIAGYAAVRRDKEKASQSLKL